MNDEEFEAWELKFLENVPVAYFVNGVLIIEDDGPPVAPKFNAKDKHWLRSCGVRV